MGNIISAKEVRRGDVILVTRKVEIIQSGAKHALGGPNGSMTIEYTEAGVSGSMLISPDTEIELLERIIEHPSLPIKVGSVIRVKSESGSGVWLLQRGGKWVSSAAVKFTPAEFMEFISRGSDVGRTFEVIA